MSQEPDPSKKAFLSEYAASDEYCQAALKAIALATKSSNALPSDNSDTWNYYSTFKDFRRIMNTESNTIWKLIKDLLSASSINAPSSVPESATQFVDFICEVNDHLMERIHSLLDEAEGLKSKEELHLMQVTSSGSSPISGSWNKAKNLRDEPVLITAKNVVRPQLHFQSHIDNSNSPFIPKLKDKPNGIKPLSILLESDESGEIEFYSHPYLFEISRFKLYPALLEPQEEAPILKVEDTPLQWVDSPSALDSMIQELLKETELAVDLEAHSYRSFMGITCLMQISTLSKDYLIDPFPIWSEMTRLNEVLTHPKILKIFHGADSDVLWLQRDFSLYIVNVFDTFRGALLLEFPKGSRSLKYLLSRYVDVKADKQYQLADWRIRPLPNEMKKYAREDTRYLIPIYRKMKKDLLEKSNREKHLLTTAFDRSNDVCKSRFEKPIFHDTKHLDMLKKNRQTFNSKQLFALKEIYTWRHRLARNEDESEHYILPNHMLMSICSELPREMQGILALCNPVPPHVRQNLVELHKIVYEARGKPLTFNSAIQETNRPVKQYELIANNDVITDPLKCPLDLSQYSTTDKLDTLLGKKGKLDVAIRSLRKRKSPFIKVFEKPSSFQGRKEISKEIKVPLSPFQRYKLLIPFLQSMKKEAEEKTDGKTDDQRINSIRKHFDEMTQMSLETQESPSVNEAEPKEVEPPQEKKKAPKRPHEEQLKESPSVPPKKNPTNFDNYDLSQLSQSPNPNPDEYNPSKQFQNKHVNKKSNNKKRFNKSGSRSHFYNKK